METFINEHPLWFTVILLVAVWDLVWRFVAMWHAARRGLKAWFIAFTVLSTAGILPIYFLVTHQSEEG